MAILTVAQFQLMFDTDRIKQLASDYNPSYGSSVYNGSIVTGVVAQAESVVKNALSLQYTATQLEADEGMKRIVGIYAMYFLEFRRGNFTTQVDKAYKDAQAVIATMQKGESKPLAVSELLPLGETEEPTEVTDSGYFD